MLSCSPTYAGELCQMEMSIEFVVKLKHHMSFRFQALPGWKPTILDVSYVSMNSNYLPNPFHRFLACLDMRQYKRPISVWRSLEVGQTGQQTGRLGTRRDISCFRYHGPKYSTVNISSNFPRYSRARWCRRNSVLLLTAVLLTNRKKSVISNH